MINIVYVVGESYLEKVRKEYEKQSIEYAHKNVKKEFQC